MPRALPLNKQRQVEKAQAAIETGKIRPVRRRMAVYWIDDADAAHRHLVTVSQGHTECSCPAGKHGVACWHVLAARYLFKQGT